jgi:quercetin dioxygenase-like cupin family protein
LKKGFEFEDKGHENEQITWLIEGKMNFHSNGESKILTSENGGIDIGPNHLHGGVSEGAIGFDAFFPKRQEAKYRT